MIISLEILIFISAMFFVGYPIFKKSGIRGLESGVNEALGELIHKKEAVYTSIKDLDFDYKTSKLSEDDYKELKEKYEVEALHILKDIDDSGKRPPLSPLLHKEGKGEVENRVMDENIIYCPKCGTKTEIRDNFCFKCGAKLPT